jgi:hypothetical protein
MIRIIIGIRILYPLRVLRLILFNSSKSSRGGISFLVIQICRLLIFTLIIKCKFNRILIGLRGSILGYSIHFLLISYSIIIIRKKKMNFKFYLPSVFNIIIFIIIIIIIIIIRTESPGRIMWVHLFVIS